MTSVLRERISQRDGSVLRERIAHAVEQYFWAVDPGWTRVRYLSEGFEHIYGMSREAVFADVFAWLGLVVDEDVARCRAWTRAVCSGESEEIEFRIQHPRRGLRWIRVRAFPCFDESGEAVLGGVAEDITRRCELEQARLDKVHAQRDLLVREVHHRIKNNLQTVVALLRREIRKHPEAGAPIEAAIAQVQSVALVHGLQGRPSRQQVMLCELLPAVVLNVSELTGVPILRAGVRPGEGALMLKESETVAVALILNELITNAVKHACGPVDTDGLRVTMGREGALARIRIFNPGALQSGFDFESGRGLGTGLGLVRALLPDSGMKVRFECAEQAVAVEITITAPVITATGRSDAALLRQVYETTSTGR